MHVINASSSLLALFALAGTTSAHGVLTAIKGANGVTAHGFGVIASTPRTGTTVNPFQQDTSIIRDLEIKSKVAGVCGRTLAGGNNAVAKQLTAAVTAGLPTINADGTVTMTLHQVNADGAGPYTCAVSADATGAKFVPMTVTTNVPGKNSRSTAAATDFPLVAKMPAGTKCSGGPNKDACLVRCRNAAPAGPFGGCAAVSNYGSNNNASYGYGNTPSSPEHGYKTSSPAYGHKTSTPSYGYGHKTSTHPYGHKTSNHPYEHKTSNHPYEHKTSTHPYKHKTSTHPYEHKTSTHPYGYKSSSAAYGGHTSSSSAYGYAPSSSSSAYGYTATSTAYGYTPSSSAYVYAPPSSKAYDYATTSSTAYGSGTTSTCAAATTTVTVYASPTDCACNSHHESHKSHKPHYNKQYLRDTEEEQIADADADENVDADPRIPLDEANRLLAEDISKRTPERLERVKRMRITGDRDIN